VWRELSYWTMARRKKRLSNWKVVRVLSTFTV